MASYMDVTTAKAHPQIFAHGETTLKGKHQRLRSEATIAGGKLVGVYDRAIFKLAVDLTDFEDFEDLEGQYKTGMILGRSFHAVPHDVFEQNKNG